MKSAYLGEMWFDYWDLLIISKYVKFIQTKGYFYSLCVSRNYLCLVYLNIKVFIIIQSYDIFKFNLLQIHNKNIIR